MEIGIQSSIAFTVFADPSFDEGHETFLLEGELPESTLNYETQGNKKYCDPVKQHHFVKMERAFQQVKQSIPMQKSSLFTLIQPKEAWKRNVQVLCSKDAPKLSLLKKVENQEKAFFLKQSPTPNLSEKKALIHSRDPRGALNKKDAQKSSDLSSHQKSGSGARGNPSERSKEEERTWEKKQQGEQQSRDQNHADSNNQERKQGNKAYTQSSGSSTKIKRPVLSPPKMGLFSLYYVLTKEGILSDERSASEIKQEVDLCDEQTTLTHQQRLEALRKSLEKEKSVHRWGVMVKMFHLIGASLGIISGAVLIATGAGAIAGTLLIAAGVIALSNQLLELTGGWNKIAERLPCDSPEKKRAIIMWAQIGITVLCLILSCGALFFGGFAAIGSSMQRAQTLFFQSMLNIGSGVAMIGRSINEFMYKDKLSDLKKHKMKLAELKHHRQNLMFLMEESIERLKGLYENLSSLLGFYDEMFKAEQMIYRR